MSHCLSCQCKTSWTPLQVGNYWTLVRMRDSFNPEAYSLDGKNAVWAQSKDKLPVPTANGQGIVPLVCGSQHKSAWGVTGYDQPGHWCLSAYKLLTGTDYKNPTNPNPPVLPVPSVPITPINRLIVAPYQMGTNLVRRYVDEANGRFITLAFINLLNGRMGWDSGDPDPAVINYIRQKGGDVILSTGGYSGCKDRTEPGLVGGSVQDVFQNYKTAIDRYNAKYIDFDIEMGTEADRGSYERRNSALKLLQDAYPSLNMSLTLPCDPSGIGGSLSMVKDAAAKKIKFQCVRVMIFDFGQGSGNFVKDTIDALQNTYRQCKEVGLNFDGVGWIGMFPKDDNNRGISIDEVRRIMAWIKSEGKTMVNTVSYWVLGTDSDFRYARALME